MGFEQLAQLKEQLAREQRAKKAEQQAEQRAKQQAKRPSAKKPGRPQASDAPAASARPAAAAPNAPSAPKASRPQAAPRHPVDPVVHTIGKLQKRFPRAFPKSPAPKLPLKVGVIDDLLAQTTELKLTEKEVRDAIKIWCRGGRYWTCLVEGADRVDLNGEATTKVTAADAGRARFLESKRSARAARPDDVKAEEAKAEAAKPEAAKPEEAQAENATAEEAKADDAKTDQT